MVQVFLKAGDLHVATEPTRLSTVVGSCIAVFIYDRRLGVGGGNHFLLPTPVTEGQIPTHHQINFYGDSAIRNLLKAFKSLGSNPSDLIVKLVGGARLADQSGKYALPGDVGEKNIALARQLLKSFGLSIAAEAVGGRSGRKAIFDTQSGELRVKAVHENNGEDQRSQRIKVLIIDDSKTIRLTLRKILETDAQFQVVGEANDPYEAMELRKTIKPDVISLDINMPRMDGVTYLQQYIAIDPVPTLIITSYSSAESGPVLRALSLGAFDYLEKPSHGDLADYGDRVREMIKAAYKSRHKTTVKNESPARPMLMRQSAFQDNKTVIAIGASTGGTEALRFIMARLPEAMPPIVVVQHIPAAFSRAFADHLHQISPLTIAEASGSEVLKPGHAYIAPGGRQMRLQKSVQGPRIEITDDPPVNRFRPSVDYLFASVRQLMEFGHVDHVIGILLTGMGADGAEELTHLHSKGAFTIAQDEASCVVFGMPAEAIARGGASQVVSLNDIPTVLLRYLDTLQRSQRAS